MYDMCPGYAAQIILFRAARYSITTASFGSRPHQLSGKLKRAAIIQITARNRSSSCAAVHCSRLQLLKFAQQCPEIRRFACTRHIAGLRATTITYGRGFEYVVQLLHVAAFEERTFCRIKVPVVLCKGQCYRAATAHTAIPVLATAACRVRRPNVRHRHSHQFKISAVVEQAIQRRDLCVAKADPHTGKCARGLIAGMDLAAVRHGHSAPYAPAGWYAVAVFCATGLHRMKAVTPFRRANMHELPYVHAYCESAGEAAANEFKHLIVVFDYAQCEIAAVCAQTRDYGCAYDAYLVYAQRVQQGDWVLNGFQVHPMKSALGTARNAQ